MWRPIDMFHASAKTKKTFKQLYDPYGDSYVDETSVDALKCLFADMSSQEYEKSKKSVETMGELWEEIGEIENEYFPDESARFGLFRMCQIFLEQPQSLVGLKIRWRGGRLVEKSASSTITHCVLDKRHVFIGDIFKNGDF